MNRKQSKSIEKKSVVIVVGYIMREQRMSDDKTNHFVNDRYIMRWWKSYAGMIMKQIFSN